MSEDIRLGALESMAALYYAQGRFLSIGVQETAAVAAKYCAARWVGPGTAQHLQRLAGWVLCTHAACADTVPRTYQPAALRFAAGTWASARCARR